MAKVALRYCYNDAGPLGGVSYDEVFDVHGDIQEFVDREREICGDAVRCIIATDQDGNVY